MSSPEDYLRHGGSLEPDEVDEVVTAPIEQRPGVERLAEKRQQLKQALDTYRSALALADKTKAAFDQQVRYAEYQLAKTKTDTTPALTSVEAVNHPDYQDDPVIQEYVVTKAAMQSAAAAFATAEQVLLVEDIEPLPTPIHSPTLMRAIDYKIALLDESIAKSRQATPEGRANFLAEIKVYVAALLDEKFRTVSVDDLLTGKQQVITPDMIALAKQYGKKAVSTAVQDYFTAKSVTEKGLRHGVNKLLSQVQIDWPTEHLAFLQSQNSDFYQIVYNGEGFDTKMELNEKYSSALERVKIQLQGRERETVQFGHMGKMFSETVAGKKNEHWQTYSAQESELGRISNQLARVTREYHSYGPKKEEFDSLTKRKAELLEKLKPFWAQRDAFDRLQKDLEPLDELLRALPDYLQRRSETGSIAGIVKKIETFLQIPADYILSPDEDRLFQQYKQLQADLAEAQQKYSYSFGQ